MENAGRRRSALFYQLAAALIFAAALILVDANIECGMNDDWSFVRTASDLALSGRLHYNGWSAPLIGLQAYWGALFVKVFGFSFLAVRASSWILTVGSIPVLWRLFRILNLSETQALFGLLTLLLSPLNLPNLATFMTDMPAFFLFVAALLSAMEAWRSDNDRSAARWILALTVCAILSGSIRQVYWLSGVWFLILLAFTRVRSRHGRALIAACVAITVLSAVAGTRWLAEQPYVPLDNTFLLLKELAWRDLVIQSWNETKSNLVGAMVLCLPFSSMLALSVMRRISLWVHLGVALGVITIAFQFARPLPWHGNTLTVYGVILPASLSIGERPIVLPEPLPILLAATGLASSVYALLAFVRIGCRMPPELQRLTALAGPFMLAYLAITGVRAPAFGLYDRYLIPVVFLAATWLLAIHSRGGEGISRVGWTTAAVFALYALATTHDYFAEARAKLRATDEILRAGHPPDAILSGFEFNSWAQVDRRGHINSDLVKNPADAYTQTDDCNGEDDVQAWWRPMTPDLSARYVVSISYLSDLQPAAFKPVDFWRWLPLAQARVYVEQVDPKLPPLTCQPGTGE